MHAKRTINKTRMVIMLFLLGLIIIAAGWWLATHDYGASGRAAEALMNEPAPDDAFVIPEVPDRVLENDIILPINMLLVTKARAAYEDGALRLVVPRLGLDCKVGDNTLMEDLENGPGLYKYSQLPDIYNTNVSIAAHRDLAGEEFYYLNTVTEGDFIYLVYDHRVFQYTYRSTEIVEPDNWDPIRTAADCRVTLTTCDPIGTSLQRMIVVGELVAWQDYTEDYLFT